MKKKLLAMLLVICMALTLLPTMALADDEPVEESIKVTAAPLNVKDKDGNSLDPVYTKYEAKLNSKDNSNSADDVTGTITLTAEGLKATYHDDITGVDGEGNEWTADPADTQYFVGVGFSMPEGTDYYMASSKTPDFSKAQFQGPWPDDMVFTEDDITYASFYFAVKTLPKEGSFYVGIKTSKDAESPEYIYKLNYNVKGVAEAGTAYSQGDVKPANLTYVEGGTAPAYGHASGYSVDYNAEARTIKIVAGDLEKTKNSNNETHYWVGLALKQSDGNRYAWGYGDRAAAGELDNSAYKAADSSQDENFDTVYWGFRSAESIEKNETGWLSVKGKDGKVVDYTVIFDVQLKTYDVTIVDVSNGTVAADKNKAVEGDTVTLTVTPDNGYELDVLTVKDGEDNNITVTNNAFVMPAGDVTVTATFKAVSVTPVTPPSIPSGGGGSVVPPTQDKTETVTSPDGTTTTTTTKPDGSKEVTVESPDGTTADVKVDASGKTQAEVSISADAADTGSVTLPIPAVPVASTSAAASTVKVNVPAAGEGKALAVTVPTQTSATGTVAVIVNPDGTEQIVKKSVVTENGLYVPIEGDAEIKIVNNAKSFTDTYGHWAGEAISFVSSHELYQGMGDGTFAPGGDMSRAMLVTVLHRLEDMPKGGGISFDDVASGQYYTEAVAWGAGSGIVQGNGSGFDPNGTVTRQQLVTFLYRYARVVGADTSVSGSMSGFNDADKVQSWASDAMSWAIGAGLINGKGGGVLDPEGNTTRAEVAAILMRFCQYMAK